MSQRWLGNLALISVAIAWGTMIPVITYLSQRWDAYFLGAVRYLLGVPLLYAALWLFEGFARSRARPAAWRVHIAGWIGLAGFAFLYTLGVAHANPVIAAVLAAANPIISAFVGRVFFAIPIDRTMTPAIVLAVVGCALATIDWRSGGIELTVRGGEALILIAAACWAWYSIAIHRWLKGWSQLRIAAHTMAAAAPMLVLGYAIALTAGLAHRRPAMPEGWDLGIFFWMIVGSVVIGLLLWNFGVSRVGIMVAALYVNLSPIVAVCILWAFGQPPTPAQIAGGVLVIGGVVWCELGAIGRARRTEQQSQ